MDMRIGTTTPGPSTASAPVRAVEATPLAPLAERYVGDLAGPHADDRRQPLFAGARVGAPDGYANAVDAATALADVTDGGETPAAVLVQRPGSERVDAFVLEAPVWKKTWFRTEVVGSTPAHVDATDGGGGVLAAGVTARTSDGVVQGTLAAGTYGPVLGSVVGLVDDTWGRLSDDVVDLGTPFRASEPNVVASPVADSKGAVERHVTRLRNLVDETSRSLGHFARYGRDAEPHVAQDAWTTAREGIASIDSALGFAGLPDEFSEPLTKLRGDLKTVDAAFASHGRLTEESTAWAAGSSRTIEASGTALDRLSQSPWLTDLDTAEIAKILNTTLGAVDSRIGRSIGQLLAVPTDDPSNERYMPLRKEARTLNLAAQEQLETLFTRTGVPKAIVSALRSADASLEDATWQIVGKPSPDGRFNGLDLPGAIDSQRTARETLRKLAGKYDVDLGDRTEPIPDVPKPAPTPGPSPTPGLDPVIARDVKQALTYLSKSVGSLESIPNDAQEAETWLPTRKSARQDNLDAQKLLEDRFLDARTPTAIASTLRRADATLEDVTWQIVGKPSPDGRFNGVDIPGAVRDTREAIQLLEGLVAS